jgi:hypothetical protein
LLAGLHAERHAHGVAGTMAALLDRTEARGVLAARPSGEQALANLEMLARLARRMAAMRPVGLREFLRSLRDVDEETPRLAEWAAEQGTADRVRLLTVHVAKGLEFPCVLLANLSSMANRRGAPVVVGRLASTVEARLRVTDADTKLETIGYEAVQAAERRREQAEERRLLYVATTRARDYLVVPVFRGKHATGLHEPLALVPGAWGDLEAGCGELPAPRRGAAVPATAPGGAAWCVASPADFPPLAPPPRQRAPRVDLRALWAHRAGWPARQAARLASGSRQPGRWPTPLDLETAASGADDGWRRLRQVLARVLEAPEDHERMAALHGASDLAVELARAAEVWEKSELRRRARQCRGARHGVRVATRRGEGTLTAWIDVVLEETSGLGVVEFVRAGSDPEAILVACESLAWKAAALTAAGLGVEEAGTFFLEDGRYLPLESWKDRLDELIST